MVTEEPVVPGIAARAQAKSLLRVETVDEDGLIDGLIASAASLCEAFTGQTLVRRGFTETLGECSTWQRLTKVPVSAITTVEALQPDGSYGPLPPSGYATDIDASGQGWLRVTAATSGRVRVGYQAGLAADWAGLPEALSHGIVRLASHLYTHRADPDGEAPPAAVTALWRPWRRLRLH